MSEHTISLCGICGTKVVDSKDERCSESCRELEASIQSFGQQIVEHKQTEDNRVYFYDVGIGELLDKYTIYLIRASKQKVYERQATNYWLNKLDESIESKVNRSARNRPIRLFIKDIFTGLLRVNSNMWRIRQELANGMADDPKYTAELALDYFELSSQRDKLKNEVDLAIEGRSRITRVYQY